MMVVIVCYMVPREWYVLVRLGADLIDTSNQRVPMGAGEVVSARSTLVEYVLVLYQHDQWASEKARPVVILAVDVVVSVGRRVNVFWDVWLSLGLVVQQNRRPFGHGVAEPKSRQTLPHHRLKQGNTHRDTSLAGMMDDCWRRCPAETVFYPLPPEWLAMMKRTSFEAYYRA